MKNLLLLPILLSTINGFSQDHFSGINTSKRVGILNIGMNPSELSNLNSRFEVQLFSSSVNVSNNKITFNDIIDGNNLENLIFKGSEPVNFNIDTEFYGPGFAIKLLKWGFAVSSKGYIKGNIVDVDPNLGSALTSNAINAIGGSSVISSANNQRMNTTNWGKLGFLLLTKSMKIKNIKLMVESHLSFCFRVLMQISGWINFKVQLQKTQETSYLQMPLQI